VKYDFFNNPSEPELVHGIHVQNVGNRIEFLLAYFYFVLNWEQYTFIEQSFHYVEIENTGRF